MRNSVSFFLLCIMLFSVAAPLIEQLTGKVLCEIKAKDEKDTEEEENEIGKEKEKYVQSLNTLFEVLRFKITDIQSSFSIENDKLTSELFSSLPKLPPEQVKIGLMQI